jgi:osmoprotectant transport system ATP-binding protein
MTVRQNIVLMAKLEKWSISEVQDRYHYLLELLDLEEEFSERYPHSLSGGQQQRVSLCRAMMLNPPLMLLDEPFSALDPITRESIHDEFLKLQKAESRSIVLVTHDMSEALKLADQLVILKDGEVIQTGSVDEVKMTPANAYVERLFTGKVGKS